MEKGVGVGGLGWIWDEAPGSIVVVPELARCSWFQPLKYFEQLPACPRHPKSSGCPMGAADLDSELGPSRLAHSFKRKAHATQLQIEL